MRQIADRRLFGHRKRQWRTRNILPARFGDEVRGDKVFVECDAEAGVVGRADPAVGGLDTFVGELVPQRRILDTVFEQKRIAAGAEPVQAGGRGHGACVAMVAESGADFLDALFDVVRIGKPIARKIDLVDVQSPRDRSAAGRPPGRIPPHPPQWAPASGRATSDNLRRLRAAVVLRASRSETRRTQWRGEARFVRPRRSRHRSTTYRRRCRRARP